MDIINQNGWHFRFSHTSPPRRALGIEPPDTVFDFPLIGDLTRYLADDTKDDFILLQRAIADRLVADPVFKAWHEKRTRLKDLPHFSKYRSKDYDRYHCAARAVCMDTANDDQKERVAGLDSEINHSQLVIPAGQILFHGRADANILTQQPYPSYISTSLNPVVARNRAFVRSAGTTNSVPLLCVLTLASPLRALWGQRGQSQEFEVLLPRNLRSIETGHYEGTEFNVVDLEVEAHVAAVATQHSEGG